LVLFIEYYKRKIKETGFIFDKDGTREYTEYKTDTLRKKTIDHAYKLERPLEIIEVPLGEFCYDKFKNWE